MRALVTSFATGLLFGAGLAVSQMINPAKVVGFLDFAGDWDPTLAAVMIGALAFAAPGFALARKRGKALLGGPMRIPARSGIDLPLLAGAGLFGLGWGLSGFCPGPALAAIGSGLWPVIAFVAAMAAGMLLHGVLSLMRKSA